jgi:hypothetical protein
MAVLPLGAVNIPSQCRPARGNIVLASPTSTRRYEILYCEILHQSVPPSTDLKKKMLWTITTGGKNNRHLRQGQDSNLRARRHPLYLVIAGERVNHSTTLTGDV